MTAHSEAAAKYARARMKRSVIVRLEDTDTGERYVYAIEWPDNCKVTLGEFYSSLPFVESIRDIVTCLNCVHHGVSCDHYQLKVKRLSRDA